MSTEKPGSDKPAKKPEKAERVLKAKAAEPEPKPKKRDWKIIMIGVLVFVALVGSLAAWLQGKASRQPEVDGLNAELSECQDAKAGCESTVTDLEGRIQLLEARRQIARAADELGEQNFGSANDALTSAAEGLRAQGQGGAADRLEQIAITPTDDPTEMQIAIRAVGRDVDRAIGR